jgi:predicted ribonuclease toxin of YeeF-YezG toxin-antitoxin module
MIKMYLYVYHTYKLISKHTKVMREQQRKQIEMITSSVGKILPLTTYKTTE